jgi:hypothetical protein
LPVNIFKIPAAINAAGVNYRAIINLCANNRLPLTGYNSGYLLPGGSAAPGSAYKNHIFFLMVAVGILYFEQEKTVPL